MLRYAITDRGRAAASECSQEEALLRQAAKLVDAGVEYVQLREKDIAAGELASLARKLLVILRGSAYAPKLLINSRADVAVAVGADGVHLTSAGGSLTPAEIRQLYGEAGLPEPIVSLSCHTLNEISAARAAGATLILFGPVFEKVVAADDSGVAAERRIAEGIGVNLLKLACAAASPTPVLALGGITAENAATALAAGAAGVAGIRMFLGAAELRLGAGRLDAV